MKILNSYRGEKVSGDYIITREVAVLEQEDVYFISSSTRVTGRGTSRVSHYCSVDYSDIHQARAEYIQDIKRVKDDGYSTKELCKDE